MFAGHYGAGLGAKAADARVPLWVLFLAVQRLDVVWSILVRANAFRRVAPRALALVLVATGYSTVFGDSTDVDAAATAGLLSTAVVFPELAWVAELRRRPRPLAARHAAPAPSVAMGR
jgi:small-conductance mechanosensitive channel